MRPSSIQPLPTENTPEGDRLLVEGRRDEVFCDLDSQLHRAGYPYIRTIDGTMRYMTINRRLEQALADLRRYKTIVKGLDLEV